MVSGNIPILMSWIFGLSEVKLEQNSGTRKKALTNREPILG